MKTRQRLTVEAAHAQVLADGRLYLGLTLRATSGHTYDLITVPRHAEPAESALRRMAQQIERLRRRKPPYVLRGKAVSFMPPGHSKLDRKGRNAFY
mgnify:CR=1 FL=1